MTTTTTQKLLLSLVAVAAIALTGCPPTDMTGNNGDNPPTDMTGDDGSGDPNNGDNTNGDQPGNGSDGMNDDGTGDGTDGNPDNGGTDDGTDPGNDDMNDGTNGGGGGGGGGTPDLPEPMLDEESQACNLILAGDGTNPGDGADRELIPATLILDEPNGSVIVRPVLPPPFDGNEFTVTPSSNATVNFICSDQISLGGVTFTDGNGSSMTPGEVAFDRGTDVICGQPITITFNFPCTVTLTSP